jgi:hypothetical protein
MRYGVDYNSVNSEADVWAALEWVTKTTASADDRAWVEDHSGNVVGAAYAQSQEDFDYDFRRVLEVFNDHAGRVIWHPPGRSKDERQEHYLPPFYGYERDMQDARREYIEAEIARTPDVVSFRAYLPGGRFEDRAEAIEFLESYPARLLSLTQMNEFGVYPVPSVTIHFDDDDSRMRYRVDIDCSEEGIPEHSFTVEYTDGDLISLERAWGDVAVGETRFVGTDVRRPIRLAQSDARFRVERSHSPANRRVFADEGWPQSRGYRGTAAGQALQIASELSREYFIVAEDALMVLLTGSLPLRVPIQTHETTCVVYEEDLQGSYAGVGPIVLTIQPWMSADDVARKYRSVQHQLFGGDNRPTTARNLALFRFVCAYKLQPEPKETACQAWNRAKAAECEATKTEHVSVPSTQFWKTYRQVRSKLFPRNEVARSSFTGFRITRERAHPGFADLSRGEKDALRAQWQKEWASRANRSRIRT